MAENGKHPKMTVKASVALHVIFIYPHLNHGDAIGTNNADGLQEASVLVQQHCQTLILNHEKDF